MSFRHVWIQEVLKKRTISNLFISIHLFSSLLSRNSQVLKERNVFLHSFAKIPRLITWERAWEMTYPICLGQVPIARKSHRSGWKWKRLGFPRKKLKYSHLNKVHRTSQVSLSYEVPFPLHSLTYLSTHPVHLLTFPLHSCQGESPEYSRTPTTQSSNILFFSFKALISSRLCSDMYDY